jgi:hypothetical protein
VIRLFPRQLVVALMLAVTAPLALSACGGSDKPGYCSDRSQLESSIKDLTNLSPANGLSGLQSQLRTIQSNANALVTSARDDFPRETQAIKTSLDTLERDVRALPSNPSASQIAALASDASSVVSAVSGFVDATQSKCD